MADDQALSGAQRAAVFLLSLGEEAAASIMQHMDPREVQSVGRARRPVKSWRSGYRACPVVLITASGLPGE